MITAKAIIMTIHEAVFSNIAIIHCNRNSIVTSNGTIIMTPGIQYQPLLIHHNYH